MENQIVFNFDELLDLRCSVVETIIHEEKWLENLEASHVIDAQTKTLIKHSKEKIQRLNMLLEKIHK